MYLDFLLFSSLLTLVDHFFVPNEISPLVKFGLFLVIELALISKFETFGRWCLGIYRRREITPGAEIQQQLCVREDVMRQESALTAFVGVLLILDGCKGLARWTTEFVPFPFFGFELGPNMYITYEILFGILFILAGIYVLKLTQRGWWLAVALLTFNISLAVYQGDALVKYGIEKRAARQAARGIAPVKDDFEKFAPYLPYFVYAFYAVPLGMLLVQRKRFTLREDPSVRELG